MVIFALGIRHPLDMTVQRFHDPDPRQHRVTHAAAQQHNLDRRLPFRRVGFTFRHAGDVVGAVPQRDWAAGASGDGGVAVAAP
jgi:hypothetical protein